jgi:LPXTG-motif cell wall-anchored protein
LRRFALALLGIAAAGLVAALPAAGKEGVKATLRTSIPLDAPAGTPLRVAWTLGYVDEHGRRQPFGGGGIFVRLRSASGAGAETGLARGTPGDYVATVLVPDGGIGDVAIGIHGWSDGKPSDLLFPITNDPLPGPARVSSSASAQPVSERADTGSRTWIFVLVGALLSTLIVLAVVLMRRRRVDRQATDASDTPRLRVATRSNRSGS